MMLRATIACIVCWILSNELIAQQVADLDYAPAIAQPTFPPDQGPRIGVDEAHHNFHTAEARYSPFSKLLGRDGYRVSRFTSRLQPDSLQNLDVLVIANPLHERNVSDWSLPTPSAFTREEITALRAWVEQGGSLLLIADHMPFPGATSELAAAFGVKFSNGYARAGHWKSGEAQTFETHTGLQACPVTVAREGTEPITRVATFGGSAFQPPAGAIPILSFGPQSWSHETTRAPGITPDAAKVPIDGWCQGALLELGRGRVAIFGEAAMFSAQRSGAAQRPMGMNAPEASQNHQLLRNVMHWLSTPQAERSQ